MTVHLGESGPDGTARATATAGGQRQKPGTPSLLRELNYRAALELLLADGPLTRAQLSERTGVSKVTVSQMLARLEERGLVMTAGEQAGGRGPNAALYAVAVDQGGEKAAFFDMDNGGKVRGAERKEKFLLSFVGVDAAGHPRADDQIKMHFDERTWGDPTIYAKYLRLPPGTL